MKTVPKILFIGRMAILNLRQAGIGFAADGMYAPTGSHALHKDFTEENAVQL